MEVVKEPTPDSRLLAIGGKQPVNQPEGGLVFEVGVEPILGEDGGPDGRWLHPPGPSVGEATGLEPVMDRGHHILADAEGYRGFVGIEDAGIGGQGLEAFR